MALQRAPTLFICGMNPTKNALVVRRHVGSKIGKAAEQKAKRRIGLLNPTCVRYEPLPQYPKQLFYVFIDTLRPISIDEGGSFYPPVFA